MEKHSLELIVNSLNRHQVKYLVAGGLAVVAHGYVRFTADIDIILAMDSPNLANAVVALKELHYQPRAPVEFERFIDSVQRRNWIEEKGLTVFSLFSPSHPATEIDLFVDPPLVFTDAYARATTMEIAPGIAATFCSFEDLIELKSQAARPRDLDDIAKLRAIRENR
jgi:hypothetical protein